MKKLLFTILICPMLTHSWPWTKKESPIQFDTDAQQACETQRTEILKKYCSNATPLQDSHPELYEGAHRLQKALGLSHVPILFLTDNNFARLKAANYNKKHDLIALAPTIIFDHDSLTDIKRFTDLLVKELWLIKQNWGKDDLLKSEIYKNLNKWRNIDIIQKYPKAQPLKNKCPQIYEMCETIQNDLGLKNVSIQFLYTDSLLEKIGDTIFYSFQEQPLNAGIFVILFDERIQKLSTSTVKIIAYHELTNAIQEITRSEGVGYKKGFHNNNCGSVPLKNLHEGLKTQAADAASLDHCICFKCLQEFAVYRKDFPSARMNEEGYCVSPSGYLSESEILEYAHEMQRTYNQEGLCAEHKST